MTALPESYSCVTLPASFTAAAGRPHRRLGTAARDRRAGPPINKSTRVTGICQHPQRAAVVQGTQATSHRVTWADGLTLRAGFRASLAPTTATRSPKSPKSVTLQFTASEP